jgi:hypothetical protein
MADERNLSSTNRLARRDGFASRPVCHESRIHRDAASRQQVGRPHPFIRIFTAVAGGTNGDQVEIEFDLAHTITFPHRQTFFTDSIGILFRQPGPIRVGALPDDLIPVHEGMFIFLPSGFRRVTIFTTQSGGNQDVTFILGTGLDWLFMPYFI